MTVRDASPRPCLVNLFVVFRDTPYSFRQIIHSLIEIDLKRVNIIIINITKRVVQHILRHLDIVCQILLIFHSHTGTRRRAPASFLLCFDLGHQVAVHGLPVSLIVRTENLAIKTIKPSVLHLV